MNRFVLVSAVIALSASQAVAQSKMPATLAGHAVMPAMTLIAPPADAPESLKVSGRFTGAGNWRTERLGAIEGRSGAGPGSRPTGLSLPFQGQPVQGMSGIKSAGGGVFWTLTDNGFGSKVNSVDAMLMVHRLRIDWGSGQVERQETIFLHDPDRLIPFPIATEHTAKRYLTGADLDVEGFQPIGESLWFGDEFGPYVVRTDRAGKVTGFWQTEIDGKPVRSPDHWAVRTPGTPGPVAFELGRSRGYEGFAASTDGRFIYGLLEGPLWDAQASRPEQADGREFLRIVEFDVQQGRWSGRSWRYPLEINGNAIGDFNMIDATRGLIIERDNGEGDPALACPANAPAPTCFATPARFKRVYMISLDGVAAGGAVRKLGYVDLMDVADPQRRARRGGEDGKFTFPFFTIENVDRVDGEHIVVANDNNLPFSAGRALDRADDNEFILLRVPELLNLR